MSIKDWVLSQLVSKSLAVARPLSTSDSLIDERLIGNELTIQGAPHSTNLVSPSETAEVHSSVANEEIPSNSASQQVVFENNSHQSLSMVDEKKLDPLAKVEKLQIKLFRLLQRLGQSKGDIMVAKVLYRIHLATLIRAGEEDLKRANLGSNKAKAIAEEQEASGVPELDFSIRVLVIGRTGVGKSSTINSIFDQTKAMTDAFQPGTRQVQEIAGIVDGIKISFIDTPGLLPSSPTSIRKNRKILRSIKRFIRKSPPDIVLYFERLNLINVNYSDFPLLKLVTEVFGSAIWFNTIVVMTHCSAALPEGPNGYPVSYEPYLTRCAETVQHYIHQAVSDSKLENPVLFVENHPQCKNMSGEKVLPNGQVWKSQFMSLSLCTKILADINTLLEFQDRIKLGPPNNSRLPSLPHLFSSFLRHHMLSHNEADNELDEICLSDLEDGEDEYDRLPPIKILKKFQFEKLKASQKEAYLDELDYRETLYLKKQLKEECLRRREKKLNNDNSDNQEESPEAVVLPDMAVPPSFDSDNPVHRYRCLATSDQWLARPVLDPHGWDHDVSFDGINLESTAKINKNIVASVAGQFSKDKQDFSIQSESCAAFVDPLGPTYSLGLDVQSSGKELLYTIHSSTKLSNFKKHNPECGVSMTSFGNKHFIGAKIEDSFLIKRRLKFMVNAGQMSGLGQVAYGGNFGVTVRGEDYPVRSDKVSLAMSILSFKKENVLGGNIESEFRLSRGTKMAVNANLNSRSMGQISVKTSSSEHMELALVGVFAICRALFRRKSTGDLSTEKLEL